MRVAQEVIAVTRSVNILDVARKYVTDLDDNNMAVCFEGHHKASKTLLLDEQTQSYYCTRPECRTHGNVIDLIESVEGCSLEEAIEAAGEFAGVDFDAEAHGTELKEYQLVRSCLREAGKFFARRLDAATDYLKSRGISCSTGERFLIGRSGSKDELKTALRVNFSEEIIRKAGLLNQYGDDFFRDRVVIPIRVAGQIVAFYGRALTDEDQVRHLRMSNDRVIIGEGLFNWNPRRDEIIAVEGIFDALALIDKGFDNAVATFGTQGFSTARTKALIEKSEIRKVYVCFDGDAAGEASAVKSAYDLEDMGKQVRIVDLNHEDPNDFLQTHNADEFKDRLVKSLSPVQFDVHRLNDELELEEKIASLEVAFRRVDDMLPLDREAMVKRVAAKLHVPKKVVEDHIASVTARDQDALQYLDLTDKRIIHPALDIVEAKLIMTVSQASADPDAGAMQWVPFIVTSDRDFFPFESTELLKRGYMTTVEAMADSPRYSSHVIKSFLLGTRTGDFITTFRRIHTLLTRNVDFPDENAHVFLTCWIIGTYFHPIFNYFPYIHFTGTKNVGKSKTMKLMSCLCFNGTMSVSITPASQFRIIEAFRPTLFMDETEDLKEKGFSDKRALLLGGYEAGSSVLRCEKEKDNYKVKRMANYGPRAFASIEGLEDTLASRTVQITMHRSFNSDIKEKEVTLSNPEFQEIRDALFLVAMTYAPTVKKVYEEMTRPEAVEFGDREFNLFRPILAIGRATGIDGVEERLIQFQNGAYQNKLAEYNRSAPENVLLQFLLEEVKQDDWFRSDSIHDRFVNYLKNSGIDLNMAVTKPFMGTLIKKLGIVVESRRSPDRTCTLYFIKVEVLDRVARNYQVI